MSTEPDIPVGALCAMYGLNPNTLRTWERRHNFPSPARGAGGHRAYSPADIALISKIMDHIAEGLSPADAIALARNEKRSVAGSRRARSPEAESVISRAILKAIHTHGQEKIRSLVDSGIQKMGYKAFIENEAFPLLARLGHAWETTNQGIADEHSFTMVIQGVILQQAHGLAASKSAPVVTFACAPGEVHQLALLHLANIVVEQKIARPLVLSAGLPIEETLAASDAAGSRILLLSATTRPASGETRRWVSAAMDAGWENRLVLAGPGFIRSRVYSDFAVVAAPGNFDQTAHLVKRLTTATT